MHIAQVAFFVVLFGVLSMLWDDFWSDEPAASEEAPTTEAPPSTAEPAKPPPPASP